MLKIAQASAMVEESQIPNTAEEIHAQLAQLAVDLQNNKELLQDEQLKYKRYEVKISHRESYF